MSDVIRVAGMGDLAAVEAIVFGAYSPYVGRIGQEPGPMRDDYAALINARHVNVLEADGVILAIVVLIPDAETMLLDNLAVAPSAQGKGFGRRLMQFAETAALAAGCHAIRLYTHVLMVENIAIYTRAGYIETHRAFEKGLHRVFMTKVLDRD